MALTTAAAMLIGSGISAATGGAGMAMNGILTKKKRKFAKEMAEQQNKYELERMEYGKGMSMDLANYEQMLNKEMYDYQFQKQTEYNDPKAQVERLKNANLNPALMYQGTGSTGSSEASAEGGNVGSPGLLQPMAIQAGLQAQQIEAQTELTRAQANAINLQNMKEAGLETVKALQDIKKKGVDIDKIEKDIEEINATIKKINEEAGMIRQNKELLQFQNEINRILKNSVEGKDEKSRDWQSVLIEKFYAEFEKDMSKFEKEYWNNKLDAKTAERLYNDIEKIVQGKLSEISINTELLEKAKYEAKQAKFEYEQDSAISKAMNSIGADGDYARILLHFIDKWLDR